MRKLINGKIRNTETMHNVVSREGNSNDCYSTYSRIMFDKRDGTHYLWSGHFWSGLGSDSLEELKNVPASVEGWGWELTEKEAEYIEKLMEAAIED